MIPPAGSEDSIASGILSQTVLGYLSAGQSVAAPKRWRYQRSFPEPAPKRYPRVVTLCLAATCVDDSRGVLEPCVVACADQRLESEWVGADVAFKSTVLAPGWMAMGAGPVDQIFRIVSSFQNSLLGKRLTLLNIQEELESAAKRHLKSWRAHLRSLKINDEWNCELIVGGFALANRGLLMPKLFIVNQHHRTKEVPGFVSTGSGYWAAEIAFKQRFQNNRLNAGDDTLTVRQALYYLYEAKRFGESAPGVGKATHLWVLTPDASRFVSQAGLDLLNDWYESFGLKPFDKTLGLPADFFEQPARDA